MENHGDHAANEVLRREGLGGSPALPRCGACSTPGAIYQCVICFHQEMLCQSCIVEAHQSQVLHSIRVRYTTLSLEPSNQRFRNGPGSSSLWFLCSTLVPPINSAIVRESTVQRHLSPSSLCSSTSPASQLSAYGTATAAKTSSPLTSSFGALAGLPRPLNNRAQRLHSVSLITSTCSKLEARSAFMIFTNLSSNWTTLVG